MCKRLFRDKRTEEPSPRAAPAYPTLEGFNRRCREILGPLVVAGMLSAGLVACDAERTVEETTDGSTQAADVLPDQGVDIGPDLPPMLGAPRMPDAGID